MLGIGLHSYGFMDAAFKWLMLFVSSQVALIVLGLLPLNLWKVSIQRDAPADSTDKWRRQADRCTRDGLIADVGRRAVLCPPPVETNAFGIYHDGAHGVSRPILPTPKFRKDFCPLSSVGGLY